MGRIVSPNAGNASSPHSASWCSVTLLVVVVLSVGDTKGVRMAWWTADGAASRGGSA